MPSVSEPKSAPGRQDSRDMAILCVTPVLVLLITLVQRRLGDRAGGRLAAVPVTSTAVIAIVGVDQGVAAAQALAVGIVTGAPVGLACLLLFRWLANRVPMVTAPGDGHAAWELVVRVGVTTSCVAGLSAAAQVLPPQVAGVPGGFPMLAAVLAVMTHRRAGPRAARDLVTGVLTGMPVSVGFLTALAIALSRF